MEDLFSAAARRDERRVYTVGELNEAIEAALRAGFPAAVWVRGEVRGLRRNANRHIYFELHGASRGGVDQMKVSALAWDRAKFGLEKYFDGTDPDLQVRENLEICLQGVVSHHTQYGLSFTLVGLDPAYTLGRLEARRRETLAALKAAGLLERNASLPFPVLPLRVGLVTSSGSAAEKDFLSGLAASGYGFAVLRADCRMMGEQMVAQVTGALRGLARAGVDAIVVTRGGGSKADLSWFDHPEIAEAIACCAVPVVTAIGHEIDRSIADVVAHHHCKTPTAAAQDLVDQVAAADARLRLAADGVGRSAARVLDETRRALAAAAAALGAAVVAQVRGRHERLVHLRGEALGAARRRLERAAGRTERAGRGLAPDRLLAAWPRHRRELDRAGGRVEQTARAALAARAARLDHLSQKAQWLDPVRQLRRGWSLTLDAGGRLLRDAGGVAPGDRLVTRLHRGEIVSIVEVAGEAGRDQGRTT